MNPDTITITVGHQERLTHKKNRIRHKKTNQQRQQQAEFLMGSKSKLANSTLRQCLRKCALCYLWESKVKRKSRHTMPVNEKNNRTLPHGKRKLGNHSCFARK